MDANTTISSMLREIGRSIETYLRDHTDGLYFAAVIKGELIVYDVESYWTTYLVFDTTATPRYIAAVINDPDLRARHIDINRMESVL